MPLSVKFSRKTGIKIGRKTDPEQQKRIDARIAAARSRVAAQKEKDAEAVERLLQEQADIAFLEKDGKFSKQVESVRMYLRLVSLDSSPHSKVDLVSSLENLKKILTSMKAMPNAWKGTIEDREKTFKELCAEATSLLQ
jgi:hypothetical protein